MIININKDASPDVCIICKKEISLKSKRKYYCSSECKNKDYNKTPCKYRNHLYFYIKMTEKSYTRKLMPVTFNNIKLDQENTKQEEYLGVRLGNGQLIDGYNRILLLQEIEAELLYCKSELYSCCYLNSKTNMCLKHNQIINWYRLEDCHAFKSKESLISKEHLK